MTKSDYCYTQVNSFRYIFGNEINDDPFHVRIVRDKMTHNLVPIFSEVHDEVETTFRELIPANEHGAFDLSFLG